jgi:hypothetical protein
VSEQSGGSWRRNDAASGRPGGARGERTTGEMGTSDSDTPLTRRADPRTNTVVTWVLRSGLGLSFVVLAVGLSIELVIGPHRAIAVRMFDFFSPRPLGERIMAVGVLLLTMTPACGVLSVLLGFAREGDRRYVAVGAIVVVVLVAAVVVGLA